LKNINLFVLFGALALLALPSSTDAQSSTDVYYPGRLWVQLTPKFAQGIAHDKKLVDNEAFISLIGEELAINFGLNEVLKPYYFARSRDITEVYELRFSEVGTELEFADLLSANPGVLYAERIPVMRPTLVPNDLGGQAGANNQYALWIIDAPLAWDINTGTSEIKVAIVDDAVLVTHPDLIPNLVPGYDVAFDTDNPMPNDPNMTHGTHVAGIVGAATNNGIGVSSIGFNLKIMPVKSSSESQVVTDAYAGVVWAADNGADVINMSWGGSGFSQTGQNILNYAYEAGCVNVAASGNDNVSDVFYPAGYDNVLSVSSTTSTDAKSGFSNFGAWVDVAAPGSNILSTYHNNFNPSYNAISGTSMASPMVAGLAGLVLSVNPELTQTQVMDCITNTADNIDANNPAFIGQLGSGRINAYGAVLCAQATLTAPPVAVINTQSNVVCPGAVVQFFGSSSSGLATTFQWEFPGGNPATSTLQNPIVAYSEEGLFDVSLNASNVFGENQITQTEWLEVSANGIDIFFSESFENTDLEASGWTLANPDDGMAWSTFTVSGSNLGSQAAGINLFSYAAVGARDGLISPAIDLSGHSNVSLQFEHAHRRRVVTVRDSLIIYVSTDGGSTFPSRVFANAENGQGSFATGVILNQNFVPSNSGDWCFGGEVGPGCFSIDLSNFDGESEVHLMFESYNNSGNNIYIDNIQLSGNCLPATAAPVADLTAASTGVCTGESVQFTDQSSNVPSSYSWTFEGGTPSTSTLPAPQVTYGVPGLYGVSLLVSNAFGSDELLIENYVAVTDPPQVLIEASSSSICAGESVTLTASGAETYTWSPNVALSGTSGSTITASPSASITYTVEGSIANCAAEQTFDIEVLTAPDNAALVSENQIAFAVTSPAQVQGHYPYSPPAAGWGSPALGSISVESPVAIARDNTAADSLLCGGASNAALLNGKIAMVYRGGCEFGTKALNAQLAGATAVIVVNNTSGALIEMAPGGSGGNVVIPAVMVSNATGAWLNAAINAGNASAVLGIFNGGGPNLCPGESIYLMAPGGQSNYLWSNGHNSALIEVTDEGTYNVDVGNESCALGSPNYQVGVYDVLQPIIALEDALTLIVTNLMAVNYQWFLNGTPVEGATSSSLQAFENGLYTVETTDANGCSSMSEPIELLVVSTEQAAANAVLAVYPVPASDQISVSLSQLQGIPVLRVYDVGGRVVGLPLRLSAGSNKIEIDISSWAPGTYIIQALDNNSVYTARFVKVN
jgi:PKD repeat protein